MNDEAPRLSLTDVFGGHDTEEHADLARLDPGVTIRGRPSEPSRAPTAALAGLERSAKSDEPSARIARGKELARGGMGVVYLGEQRSLGRIVAVKELREDTRSRATAQGLREEAWVLGAIEHPNVVPIYDLMLDAHGDPSVVLKRIEGESWSSLLADESRVREGYGASDVLEWHLSVLMQVANAVSFAHSRGLIHRDIKPENVMVGRFGEVYLVDWGIAVAITDDGTGRFHLTSEVRSFAGTPRYMAPEMLGGRGAELGVHTDVYLLGATLFHVVAGRAPHRGGSIMEIATQLACEDPVVPDDVPARLADICRTAMARDPKQRFASADAFRAAIADFLRRRDALVLAEEGEKKLAELAELAAARPDDPEAHRALMFNTYSEARLGFRLARRISSEDEQVIAGLQRANETMIAYLLDQGDVASASTLVSGLVRPLPPDLAARYEAGKRAENTQRRRLAELEALGREADATVGSRTRFIVYALMAGVFVLGGIAGHFHHATQTHSAMIGLSVAMIAALSLVGLVTRRSLLVNALSKNIFFAVLIAFGGKLLIHATIAILGEPAWHGYVLVGLVYAAVGATIALRYQRWVWPIAISFAAAALGGAVWPSLRYLFFAGASLLMVLVLAWMYRLESGKK